MRVNMHLDINNLFESTEYWPKPKGIHWKTFHTAKAELAELENKYWKILNLRLQLYTDEPPTYNT